MSFIDKIAAAIMPPESDEDRRNARRMAETMTAGGDWLSLVLGQHRDIEAAFDQALGASAPAERTAALKHLASLLTAHANAEETALYPMLADIGEKSAAGMAYEEQAMTKIQMAKLERIDPMSTEWREKLEHVRGAVLHHMYEEEGTWFPKLQQHFGTGDRAHAGHRFVEEFGRYAGQVGIQSPAAMAAMRASGSPPQAPGQMMQQQASGGQQGGGQQAGGQPPANWGAADY